MDLVIDVGNFRIKGGYFEDKKLVHAFSCAIDQETLKAQLKTAQNTLVSSVNTKGTEIVKSLITHYTLLEPKKLKMVLDVDEPEALGHDRIANSYGALVHFPVNDCIIVDIGTAITVDLVLKEGHYIGGAIYPGSALCAKALANYTDKLPLVTPQKPESALGKTTLSHLQSGLYYGELGAVERMIDEIKQCAPAPTSVKVLATGGSVGMMQTELAELTDLIDPHLTLIGLREIQEELRR